jgi:hypothetical protein
LVTNKKITDDAGNIVIKNEDDAYRILELAAEDKIGEYNEIIFDGWPTLNIYLKGEKFQKSLTPTVMKGLIELQKGIYQSYSAAKFNTPNKRLTDEEKDSLELRVVVNEGSSDLDINFTEIAVQLVRELGPKLDPNYILITVVGIAVMYFGHSAYKTYLENRKEVRLKEISDEHQKDIISALKFTSEQETKRSAILADVIKSQPNMAMVEKIAYDTHTDLVKSVSAGAQAKIGDTPLTPDISETLTQNARRKSREVRIDGIYRLIKLDWTNPSRFKVRVFNTQTGLELDAEVQDDSLTGQYKDAIKNAEWSRKPIHLEINAKQLGDDDQFYDAVIVTAKMVDDDSTK